MGMIVNVITQIDDAREASVVEFPDVETLTIDDNTVTVESFDGTKSEFKGRVVLQATHSE